jgi:hypothetical protein
MIARKVERGQLERALVAVGERYGGNVRWNREPSKVGRGWRFTLRVHDSKKSGHRTSAGYGSMTRHSRPRRMISACWHVHGHFFEELFRICPDAVITTGRGLRITDKDGNWQDFNIGSMAYPVNFSEACDCDTMPAKPRVEKRSGYSTQGELSL